MTKEYSLKNIAISAGDPNGIGYDLCAMLFDTKINHDITIFSNQDLLLHRAKLLKIDITSPINKNIRIQNIPLKNDDKDYRLLTLDTIKSSALSCLKKKHDALVTLPVNKKKLSSKSLPFIGHTEYLAEILESKNEPIMCFTADQSCLVAINSTHLSLADAIKKVSTSRIEKNIKILYTFLKIYRKIDNPKILLTGLNPHAGEDGIFGLEEINIITPAIKNLESFGISVDGPSPGDTAFIPKNRNSYDCIYYMYHDQALSAFKSIYFDEGVNVSVGLPIIRTSVDHGTAEDLVGKKDCISTKSLLNAIDVAASLI